MQRSFKSRIEALELVEAQARGQAARDAEPLSDDDLQVVAIQVDIANVRVENGRAVRVWRLGSDELQAQYDRALAKLNTSMQAEGVAPATVAEFLAWLWGNDDEEL